MKCDPPCNGCHTAHSCVYDDKQETGMSIDMYDPAMPTPFEFIDEMFTWVQWHFLRLIAVCAAVGFVLGLYVVWR